MKEEICLVNIPKTGSDFQIGDVVQMDVPVLLSSFFFCHRGIVISNTNVSTSLMNVVGYNSNLQRTLSITKLGLLPEIRFDFLNKSV